MQANATKALTQNSLRSWIQPGGAGPENPLYFAGVNWEEVQVSGGQRNLRGSRDPINRHDPRRPGRFVRRGQKVSPPDNNSVTVEFAESCGGIPRAQLLDCPFNIYELKSCCGDPGDFLHGWDGSVTVYSGIDVESMDLGDRTSFEGQEQVTVSASADVDDIYDVSELSLGVTPLDSSVTAAIVGVTFGDTIECGDCGPGANCDSWIYAIDSAGMLFYRSNAGWGSLDLSGTGIDVLFGTGTYAAKGIATLGRFLVVLYSVSGATPDEDGIAYTELSSAGLPGQTTGEWWKLTPFKNAAGAAIAGADPILMQKAGNVLYVVTTLAQDGTNTGLWRISSLGENADILLDTGNLAATPTAASVSVLGDTIVVGMSAGKIALSRDAGQTWSLVTAIGTSSINDVECVSSYLWWAATSTGLFYTTDAGVTWTEKVPVGAAAAGVYAQVNFANAEVGYAVSSAGTVYATWNGGYSWSSRSPRMRLVGEAVTTPKVALADCSNANRGANSVLLGGTTGLVFANMTMDAM